MEHSRDALNTVMDQGQEYVEAGREGIKQAARTANETLDTAKQAAKHAMEIGKETIKESSTDKRT